MRYKDKLHLHPLHSVWFGMKQRCYNRSSEDYRNYGGRGIDICFKWINDFRSFINWGIENGWEEGLTIDRKDNNRGYSPKNCRFVTKSINNQNRRKPTKEKIDNDFDKRVRIPIETHNELSKINDNFGIPLKALIDKALKYAFANPKKVFGFKL